jgi:hemoglobin
MECTRFRLALALCFSPSLAACGANQGSHPADPQVEMGVDGGSGTPDAASPQRTLYERLGGREGIHAISDTFLKKLKADARIGSFFKNKSGLLRLEEQLCQLSGGPCRYSGKDMKTAHEGIGITDAQFDAFMEDFKSALSERSVSPREQSELVATLAPMRAAIVEKKGTK